jgi:hypothetical protein
MASFELIEANFWHMGKQSVELPSLTGDMVATAERDLNVLPGDLVRLLRVRNGGIVADAWNACQLNPTSTPMITYRSNMSSVSARPAPLAPSPCWTPRT